MHVAAMVASVSVEEAGGLPKGFKTSEDGLMKSEGCVGILLDFRRGREAEVALVPQRWGHGGAKCDRVGDAAPKVGVW